MFIALLILFVSAIALPLTVERTDNGSIIVSHSVVVSRGRTTNISSSIVIRNKKKPPSSPSTGNESGVSTRRRGCTASVVPAKITELIKRAHAGETVEVGSRVDFLTKTSGMKDKNGKKSTAPFDTTIESFLNAFKQNTSLRNGASKTSPTAEMRKTGRPGLAAEIVRLLWKRTTTTKASKRPVTQPILASEMLRDSFQIDYGWVHQKRARRQALDYNASDVNNTAVKLKTERLDKDSKLVLLLLIALLLLALSSIMSYRPSPEHPYSIRLRPGASSFYQPVPTSECMDTVERKSNLGLRDMRFASLARTKILVSRMVRRWRGRCEQKASSL